ncbi:hypothetical protein [Flavobacterium sp. SM2513]|uniref:hypothetical protein n=1 Tax=Flavobacterium sp. SM2513 TaxID=3424766 RepID=UPI003D7FD82D
MNLSSKFNSFYLIKLGFFPTLCIGFSLLLIDVKLNYKKDISVVVPVLVLVIIGAIILYYNLKRVFSIVLEEKHITKTYFFSKKKEVIPYDLIKSLNTERIEPSYSDAGQITDGYYDFSFTLKDGKELNVSPAYFDNYLELIKRINERRNELD